LVELNDLRVSAASTIPSTLESSAMSLRTRLPQRCANSIAYGGDGELAVCCTAAGYLAEPDVRQIVQRLRRGVDLVVVSQTPLMQCRLRVDAKKILLHRAVVWVIFSLFRPAVCCCCRCVHVGNALALTIMFTAMLGARAMELAGKALLCAPVIRIEMTNEARGSVRRGYGTGSKQVRILSRRCKP
jgi:hypothetical protein